MNLTAKEFEQLLCEFCKQDLPTHFTIEHDVKDKGEQSENSRQIDTKIKGKIGISDILICGEAKNWSSPVDGEVIDALVGKYLSGEIRANKAIVFSNNGYTEPAIKRAKLLGIELLQPEELGKPIKPYPYIVGLGYLGRMQLMIVGSGPQYSEMSINAGEYVLIKGSQKISFQQNVCRLVVQHLRLTPHKTIFSDLSELQIKDENVLYELKHNPGYRYNASFDVNVSIVWDYFIENLPTGILRHMNSDEMKVVNMQGSSDEILNKVLFSPTRLNYEDKQDCIDEVVEKNIGHIFTLCMVDPDRHKSDPQHLLLIPATDDR